MAKRRKLDDISVEEVSIVDKAANKRRFMFIKRDETTGEETRIEKVDTDITIKSDGSNGGTTIPINGRKIDRVHEASFAFFDDPDNTDGDGNPVYFRYVTSAAGKSNGGFRQSKTFVLSKAEVIEKTEYATEEDLAVIGAFVGVEISIDGIDGNKAASIAKSLSVAEDYLDVAPAEFRGAIKDLVRATLPSSQDKSIVEKADDEKKEETVVAEEPKKEEVVAEVVVETPKEEPKEEPVKSPEIDLEALADKVAEKMLAVQAAKEKANEETKTEAPETTESAEEDQSGDDDDDTVEISAAELAGMVVAAADGEGVHDEDEKV